ncbi:CTD kinase subunit gamma [Schizosaccharomyces pombe]|uniref:CTD kinase subunit gamma n=2 Tax=Schizosaccharomyces pombe TaxID=4896 RepID=CTK3_SCHPO|nr:putative Lsk1 complex gamma subunit lsg1 [Schizosaccharomyces pombe]Q9USJ8.1 RecName: Full=CTD kinase subunit gamma; Short=CTDK-I gamma subunit; AltName: Full=CTD kinase subunit 3 [Schizosaccharomyces pombe 972h-]CAB60682.1 Lsk1 complex gamma subunit (predicted) [Schizosaccharomyces pombe]|eukprot:NP_588082.1 putative Lsk1 complex gamma subunit lsg1 [Schizosaccharomyces pombe]
MDPFEGRMTFLQLLGKLNASQFSQIKPAQFAIKHLDLEEDLYSCIWEELESGSFNTRVNIMYFVDTLCEMCLKNGLTGGYLNMISRDICKLVQNVAPIGAAGAANAPEVRKVLQSLHEKKVIDDNQYKDAMATVEAHEQASKSGDTSTSGAISKNDILKRIEEDRERHKRMRENIWAISEPELEAEIAWNTTQGITESDLESLKDEYEKFNECLHATS